MANERTIALNNIDLDDSYVYMVEHSKTMKTMIGELLTTKLNTRYKADRANFELQFKLRNDSHHVFYVVFATLMRLMKGIEKENQGAIDDLDDDLLDRLVNDGLRDDSQFLLTFWEWINKMRDAGELSYVGLTTPTATASEIIKKIDHPFAIVGLTLFEQFCTLVINYLMLIDTLEFATAGRIIKFGETKTMLVRLSPKNANNDHIDRLCMVALKCAIVPPAKPAPKGKAKKGN